MFNGKRKTTENNDQLYMRQALTLAKVAGEKGEVPVGAVVVHKGKIIGRGYNQTELLKDPTAHAEMIAISAACSALNNKYLNDCSLYVTLEPCPMCAGAIVWSKLTRLVFGAIDEKAGACGSVFNISSNKKLNHRVETIHGLYELESQEMLKEFFNKKR